MNRNERSLSYHQYVSIIPFNLSELTQQTKIYIESKIFSMSPIFHYFFIICPLIAFRQILSEMQ